MSPFDGATTHQKPALVDPFGRTIDYLRVSVTDRCDFRCVYCMAEHQEFLPKAQVLTIEELDRLCSAFIGLGTKKLRLTGGEPLVRKGFMTLVEDLSRHLKSGDLKELTLTTNGSQLARYADELAGHGVKRINVSIDSLRADVFRRITRGGDLDQVLAGVKAARAAGIAVKINTVALKHDNADELPKMIQWAHGEGLDLTLIETMPLGDIEEDRTDQYLSLKSVRQSLESYWTLTELPDRTAGPARYVRIEETGGRLGLITPLSHTFCESCNRVRVTCTGTLYMCLGQDDQADLRAPMREDASDASLVAAIREALGRKPKGHDFHIERRGEAPAVRRPMSTTGG
jgi:cyclic pyranopterin phosphate synthase